MNASLNKRINHTANPVKTNLQPSIILSLIAAVTLRSIVKPQIFGLKFYTRYRIRKTSK